jgi:hypothetical protein
MWIKEKVWTRKCEFFFWKFAVSRNKTLTEGIMLSVKVFLRRVFFLCREPNLQALGEFNGRRRPWRLRLRSRQPNPSPRAEGRKHSAKVLFTVGQSFAESQILCSRRRGASPRAGDLALAEASSSDCCCKFGDVITPRRTMWKDYFFTGCEL